MADLRLVSINLYWRQSRERKIKDINDVKGQADIICFQECYNTPVRATLGSGWNFHQGNGPGNEDNAIAWRTSRAKLIDKGYHHIAKLDAARNKTFKIAWVKLLIDGEKRLVVGSTHPPHGGYTRYDSGLYGRCMDGTVEWWRKHADWGNVIIGGDWNKQIKDDPGNLASRLPGVWSGAAKTERGIDGFLRHQNIEKTRSYTEGLFSDHPAVYVHVRPSTINRSGGGSNPRPDPDPETLVRTIVRIGTYNAWYKTSNEQTKADFVDDIFPKVDVLALQEWGGTRRRSLDRKEFWEDKGWDIWHPPDSGTAVAWNTKKYKMLRQKVTKIQSNREGNTQDKYLPHVKLQNKETGAVFWAVSGHMQWMGTDLAKRTRREQLRETRQLFNQLNPDAPTILAGDWNTKEPFKQGLGDGLASYPEQDKAIDQVIWSPKNIRLQSGHFKEKGFSSDHPFVWTELKLTSEGRPRDPDEPERPSTPDPEEPTPPKQPAEPDTGANEDIDHDDCCGGTEKP
jgi:hypothetical protein